MADQRNISIEIPKSLLDQIQQRSRLNGRSRNAEFRYLLQIAFDSAQDEDVVIKLPDDKSTWKRCTARIDYAAEMILIGRCRMYKRSVGPELVRLVAYAIEERTKRDLAIIAEMMQRQGQAATFPRQPEPLGSQPAEPG